jgi:uncharacterized membrane-anchored protein
MKRILASLFVLIAALSAAPAQEPKSEVPPAVRQFVESLKFQSGEITLQDGLAKIALPESFRFLGSDDASKVLTKLWGNPPGAKPLGMLVPTNADLASGDGWAVIVTFEEDGYVKDGDAAKINYNDLLKEMKEGVAESNKERAKEGYPTIELVGWAAPPRYDATAKKMYWAKELKFGGEEANTLNYGIRMLGRRGVLVLNAVASMAQLPEIEAATPAILGMVDFQAGHRYADFNSKTDEVASYGLAALVAGGVMAKTGMFAKLGLIFAKFAKVIIVGGLALFGMIAKFFKGRKVEA